MSSCLPEAYGSFNGVQQVEKQPCAMRETKPDAMFSPGWNRNIGDWEGGSSRYVNALRVKFSTTIHQTGKHEGSRSFR